MIVGPGLLGKHTGNCSADSSMGHYALSFRAGSSVLNSEDVGFVQVARQCNQCAPARDSGRR